MKYIICTYIFDGAKTILLIENTFAWYKAYFASIKIGYVSRSCRIIYTILFNYVHEYKNKCNIN